MFFFFFNDTATTEIYPLSLHDALPIFVYADGRYQVKGVPDRALGFTEIAARAYSGELPPDLDAGLEATEFFRPPQLVYPFGAHVAVLELDTETGRVQIGRASCRERV